MKCTFFTTILAFLFFLSFPTFALAPENHLTNEQQEQRAIKLFLQVRCLVCQGQVIENSNTEFAFEMRKLIRQKVSDGKSDDVIKAELVKEFGSDILVYSDFGKNNFLLWLLPITLAIVVPSIFFIRRKQA